MTDIVNKDNETNEACNGDLFELSPSALTPPAPSRHEPSGGVCETPNPPLLADSLCMVIDFEATGLDDDAQATQVGYERIGFVDGVLHQFSSDYEQNGLVSPYEYCKPDVPITLGAMATTGICEEDVADAQDHRTVVADILPEELVYIVGHNVDYDLKIAKNAGFDISKLKAIDTLALARKLYPDIETHSLTALLYHIDYQAARKYAQNAHNAGYDVAFCYRVLAQICSDHNITSMDQLYAVSEKSRIPSVVPFGRDKGKDIAELSESSVKWMLTKAENVDIYLIRAICQAHGISDDQLKLMRSSEAEEQENPTVMPFGKHEGTLLADLDGGYINWLLSKDFLQPPLKAALEKIMASRKKC